VDGSGNVFTANLDNCETSDSCAAKKGATRTARSDGKLYFYSITEQRLGSYQCEGQTLESARYSLLSGTVFRQRCACVTCKREPSRNDGRSLQDCALQKADLRPPRGRTAYSVAPRTSRGIQSNPHKAAGALQGKGQGRPGHSGCRVLGT